MLLWTRFEGWLGNLLWKNPEPSHNGAVCLYMALDWALFSGRRRWGECRNGRWSCSQEGNFWVLPSTWAHREVVSVCVKNHDTYRPSCDIWEKVLSICVYFQCSSSCFSILAQDSFSIPKYDAKDYFSLKYINVLAHFLQRWQNNPFDGLQVCPPALRSTPFDRSSTRSNKPSHALSHFSISPRLSLSSTYL